MQGNELTDDLFALLHQFDDTWTVVRESDTAVVLEHACGKQIHAPTLELALRAAINLYGYEQWNSGARDIVL